MGSHEVVGYGKTQQFLWSNGLDTQNITKINKDKSMAYITNESDGNFQQGGSLYKPTSGTQWTPEHSWMSNRPQKQVSNKVDLSNFGSGVVVIS